MCEFCHQPVSSVEDHQEVCEALLAIFSRAPTAVICELCEQSIPLGELDNHKVAHLLEHKVSGEFIDIESFKNSSMKSRGLNLDQIKNELPVIVCTRECLLEQCSVCMCSFETSDQLRLLPCFHKFHVTCIDTWLNQSISCPICKVDI